MARHKPRKSVPKLKASAGFPAIEFPESSFVPLPSGGALPRFECYPLNPLPQRGCYRRWSIFGAWDDKAGQYVDENRTGCGNQERYQRSNRTGRTAILDEFVAVTGTTASTRSDC